MNERKYQLTRIREGDYIVPSNDGETLWRISKYEETGLGEYLDAKWKPRKIAGWFWQTAKFHMSVPAMQERFGDDLPNDFLDWDRWEHWSSGFTRRKDAVEDVVR
jgi:hypothetical protein